MCNGRCTSEKLEPAMEGLFRRNAVRRFPTKSCTLISSVGFINYHGETAIYVFPATHFFFQLPGQLIVPSVGQITISFTTKYQLPDQLMRRLDTLRKQEVDDSRHHRPRYSYPTLSSLFSISAESKRLVLSIYRKAPP